MRRTLLLLATVLLAAGTTRAADWSHWRGPEMTGVSRDKGLPSTFSSDPKTPGNNLLWTAPVGGRTTPIVQKGRVYFITAHNAGAGPASQQEKVVCLDADSGKQLWESVFNVFHTAIVTDRLGWTTMVGDPETDTVFAHSTAGVIFCFNHDGKVLWQHSMTEEFGRISGYGGRLTSPIIDGDLLLFGLINASWGDQAVGRNRFVAMDKRTGEIVWWNSTGHPVKDTHASIPVVAVVGGQRLLISGGGDGGVHAFKVRTGEKVWSYIFGAGAVNCSPVVDGDLVYIGHGEINANPATSAQGRVICVDGGKVTNGAPKLVWRTDGMKVKFASPLLHAGRLYVCDDLANMYCLDAKTGQHLWEGGFSYGKNGKGSPVWADGKIYIGTVDSTFLILEPGDKDCKVLHAESLPAHGGVPVEVNGSAAVADGRVYFMTTAETFCLGSKEHKAKADPIPEQPKETPAKPGAAVTHVQVRPADVTVFPGESVALKAYGYDETGHLVGEVKVDWSLAGSRLPEGVKPMPGDAGPPELKGELSEKAGTMTKLTVAPAPPGQFGRVLAKAGEATAEVRVRVAPSLKGPYKVDFSKIPEGRTPGGWVNTQGKFAVVKLPTGEFALRKTTAIASPLVARANAYIGLPSMGNYTIEAEVQGNPGSEGLPDIGVVAARYTLQLAGPRQQIRLLSWEALPRIDQSLAYEWKPATWYHLKLQHAVDKGKVTVRAKIWPSGEDEPKAWTLEVNDETPNLEGAPALYAYAVGTTPNQLGEALFRNVVIVPNK